MLNLVTESHVTLGLSYKPKTQGLCACASVFVFVIAQSRRGKTPHMMGNNKLSYTDEV